MKIQEPIYVTVSDWEDIKNYLLIQSLNSGIIFNFILMNEKTLMPRRKKTTVAEWLKKNGFTYYIWPDIPNFKKL